MFDIMCTIFANNNSKTNKYIQAARLNSKDLNQTTITHNDITEGGTLVLEMGDMPNKEWGTR